MTAPKPYGAEPVAFRAVSYPCRLYAGDDALASLAVEAQRQHTQRAFVICGRTIATQTNVLHRIEAVLGGLYAGAFDRMDKDSSYAAVVDGTQAARAAGADLIIAVGGGSVIVGARAIVIFLAEQGDPYELMTQYPPGEPAVSPRLMAPKLPIINVPTTPTTAMNRAGTGLKNPSLDHRMEFFDPKTRPVALFWDSEALLTAPLALARSTGTTTFNTALRGIAAGGLNPLVDGDRQQSFHLASRALRRLVQEPSDPQPRIDLCAAALLQNRAADDGASGEGREPAASAAYALATAIHSRYDHVGQGEATAAVTPASVGRLAGSRDGVAARMAQSLGVWQDSMTPDTAAAASAGALEAFYRSLGMPARVRDLEVPEADLPLLARETLKNFNANPGERPPQYEEQMLELLLACW